MKEMNIQRAVAVKLGSLEVSMMVSVAIVKEGEEEIVMKETTTEVQIEKFVRILD
jgi:hypothetical protein